VDFESGTGAVSFFRNIATQDVALRPEAAQGGLAQGQAASELTVPRPSLQQVVRIARPDLRHRPRRDGRAIVTGDIASPFTPHHSCR